LEAASAQAGNTNMANRHTIQATKTRFDNLPAGSITKTDSRVFIDRKNQSPQILFARKIILLELSGDHNQTGRGMPSAKYTKRTDGEGWDVPSGQIYRIACCDCGLVHDFVFVSSNGEPIGIAARRNERATAQRRRKITINKGGV
jgi:hypothetical protein